MKLVKILRVFMFIVLLGTITSACSNDDEQVNIGAGTVTGIVTDETGSPIAGVTVAVSGKDETVSSGIDGKYTIQNVSMESHAVVFVKTGWQTISATVTAKKFVGSVATVNITMVNASAKISGIIIDAKNGGVPLSGVTVSIGPAGTVTTGTDGKYLFENLVADEYTVTFTKANYVTITKTVTKASFEDGAVILDLQMGGTELLRGLTRDDLLNADKWYYNEYRGGGNADAYPHWDWACDYMCSLSFWGNREEQWEGTTLRTRNDEADRKNPADLNVFDSYTWGSKKITADNKILSLRVRTHDADASAPAYFGVQVVDLSAAEPVTEKIGDVRTHGSGNYADYHFDLSQYIGKEVIVAIGIYRNATGNYWKQLVLRRVAFAQENVTNWDWIPGNEVIDGWKLTHEMVRSTMIHTKKSFTGISPISAGRDVNMTTGYPAAYRAWRNVAHIGHEWAFVPLHKDPEVFPSEGYLIKTRGSGTQVNTKEPEAYFYSKFAIAPGSNQLTLKTRNFGSNYTFFKLTAIKEDGTIVHVAPKSNTAQDAAAAADGCWKFKHGSGGAGDPDGYASFVYDLSQFNGNDVMLIFGVYKGESNGDESKLVFYNINLN
ncbi:carboxypeptidase regulatory-like domain-containing protein [Dysgonomonas sp. GY75]|uniref:MSCRAMM family protein n=1 Tax=Dysgonomonas sp. GY75 TaxID=2780419 RepID=UPI001883D512|nr:carboxypeptidase-like regulatory domain-containing protein [Dysgonomonas sp. GY75]MBF0647845.1 carboxypeptidase regulatory-like domain-containing protein [Dysgonomonas sp. GY75]